MILEHVDYSLIIRSFYFVMFYYFFKLVVWLLLVQLANNAEKLWYQCLKIVGNFVSVVTLWSSKIMTFIGSILKPHVRVTALPFIPKCNAHTSSCRARN